jgi:glycosyltransferase involved in cell wall biosynthesis
MIEVGVTEMHGIAHEYSTYPPDGVNYSEVKNRASFTDHIITSGAIGMLNRFDSEKHDLIEAPLLPIMTKKNWIYTPGHFSSSANFSLLNAPIPKLLRIEFVKSLLKKDNFKKLIFKSRAGYETLFSYGNIKQDCIIEKATYVYPAIRKVSEEKIIFSKNGLNLLFSGDFLRKGGVHVVDAFVRIQKEFPDLDIKLRMCSLENFRTNNKVLESKYKKLISENKKIMFGYVTREEMLNKVLVETDIFLSPTYRESFGYALIEAMAYGIPVISTKHFAIPEIIEDKKNGYLIDFNHFDFIKNYKGYLVDAIPTDFHEFMTEEVYQKLKLLIEDFNLRKMMGLEGIKTTDTKFSFNIRNRKMKIIYEEALS